MCPDAYSEQRPNTPVPGGTHNLLADGGMAVVHCGIS